MSTTKFAIRIATKIIILMIISTIAFTFLNSPIITNELAMTQMENSDELYIAVETYNRVRSIISVIYSCFATLLAGTTICNIYKFIKTK